MLKLDFKKVKAKKLIEQSIILNMKKEMMNLKELQ
jgi:hypothetical protein